MRRVAITAVIFLVLALAACRPSGQQDQDVSFMISGDPAELNAYRTLVEAFEAEHPAISIALIHVPGGKEFREKLSAMYAGNIPPDVFLYNYRRLGDYAAAGAVHPLGDRLAASNRLNVTDFYPVTLDAFTFQGELQCIPQNISSPVIYYNVDLLEEVGLPVPPPDWDLDTFLSYAQVLTLDRNGDGRTDQWGFGTEIETIRLAPFVWSRGGEFFNDTVAGDRFALKEPEALAAIQWFVDLQRVHGVMPDLVAETAQSSEDRFLNGTVAMIMDSRVAVPALRTITGFEWDTAPLPLGGAGTSVLHSDGFCMSARAAEDADHAQNVWTFIEFALSETGQATLAATGRTVPSLIPVAESPAFLESAPPANNRVWLEAAERMRPLPMLPGWTTFEELLSKELGRLVYGDMSMEEFLERAEALAGDLFP